MKAIRTSLAFLLGLGLATASLGCTGDAATASGAVEKPANGSPVGATFLGFGEKKGERTIKLAMHNFGDEAAWGYGFMIRYKDEAGATLKVRAGTAHESDVDIYSMSGTASDKLEPNGNTEAELDFGLNIPAQAKSAEILVTSVTGANADLTTKNLWSAPYSQSWPAESTAKK